MIKCPNCGILMEKHIYHYRAEKQIKYICPRCGYTEVHHYPRRRY